MASSYRKIDYRLRPAKAVERRMIAEYFLRLRGYGSVEGYLYVGLGSVYFSDFALFHNVCGFKDMVSIEDTDDETIKKRFHFNTPLGSIKLQFGHTNVILPTLSWEKKAAVWMDYDGKLERSVLTDFNFLASKVPTQSIVLMTINGELRDDEGSGGGKIDILSRRIGMEAIPARFQEATTVAADKLPELYREIFSNALQATLIARNAGKQSADFMCAEQVAFFKYADGVTMFTFGWVFFEEKDRSRFEGCGFSELPHSRSGAAPFSIDIPYVTNAEIRALNRCKAENGELMTDEIPLPPAEIAKYLSLNRFWPVIQIPEMT